MVKGSYSDLYNEIPEKKKFKKPNEALEIYVYETGDNQPLKRL